MSSVLEALKKLDQERTERKKGVVNFEREILKSTSEGTANRGYFPIILALAASLAVLLLLLVFLWWRPFSAVDPSSETIAVRQKVPAPDSSKTGRLPMPAPTAPSPGVDKTETASVSLQGEAVSTPFQPEKNQAMDTHVSQPLPAPGQEVPAAASVGPDTSAQPAVPPPIARPQPDTPAQPLPMLSVAGIAFREDRSSRLAIINGQPVGIGETIEGAKVEDILEDKISLSYQGRKFFLGVGESTKGL